jgi:hypothetical protein
VRNVRGASSAGYILERLASASRPFGTTMEIKGEMATVTVTGN